MDEEWRGILLFAQETNEVVTITPIVPRLGTLNASVASFIVFPQKLPFTILHPERNY